jgi:hypothetical protein
VALCRSLCVQKSPKDLEAQDNNDDAAWFMAFLFCIRGLGFINKLCSLPSIAYVGLVYSRDVNVYVGVRTPRALASEPFTLEQRRDKLQVMDDNQHEGMVKLVPGLSQVAAIRHVLAHRSSSAPALQLITPLVAQRFRIY